MAIVLIVGVFLVPSSAVAQHLPLAQVLPDLVLREIVLQRGLTGPPHEAHFSPLTNELNNPVVGIVQSFNTQMATQFSTFPLGSSTGGLTYVFDESLGTLQRGSASFGPMFAERALTIGRRKLSVGFNYQRTSYDTFEGQNLDDGSIKFYLRHQDCCHFDNPAALAGFTTTPLNGSDRLNPPFKGDVIEAALSLRATSMAMRTQRRRCNTRAPRAASGISWCEPSIGFCRSRTEGWPRESIFVCRRATKRSCSAPEASR